jgi:hypothetical protein
MEREITLDGTTFEGMYKLSSALFIDKDWAFAPGETVPTELSTYDSQANNMVRNKVYGKAEFFTAMAATATQLDPAPSWQMPEAVVWPSFESPEMERAAAALKAQQIEYFSATDVDRQLAIQRGQMAVLQPLMDALKASNGKLSKTDMETYNSLASGNLIWRGARVLPK